MNTCPTCGQSLTKVNNILTIMVYPTNSIMIDGTSIRLTRSEMTIAGMLYDAMKRSPVHRDNLLNALYLLKADEPEYAEKILNVFIHRFRRKLAATNLSIVSYRPHRYGFVYEARKAA